MEGAETAVAWPHSRECTKEPISGLPNYMVQRESSELERNYAMSYRKNGEVEVVPVVDLIAKSANKSCFCGQYTTGDTHQRPYKIP